MKNQLWMSLASPRRPRPHLSWWKYILLIRKSPLSLEIFQETTTETPVAAHLSERAALWTLPVWDREAGINVLGFRFSLEPVKNLWNVPCDHASFLQTVLRVLKKNKNLNEWNNKNPGQTGQGVLTGTIWVQKKTSRVQMVLSRTSELHEEPF